MTVEMMQWKQVHAFLTREERLRKALDDLTDFYVYPLSFDDGKGGGYKERNEFQNGWNACVSDTLKRLCELHLEPGDWD